MILIPAIDIRGGKCVRLTQGKADKEKVYGDDPVEAALRWQDQGAKRLHIVDLDGALKGELVNKDIIFGLWGGSITALIIFVLPHGGIKKTTKSRLG